ncbi:MAG TPA: iron-sulfur cluster repair di-iron protein, ric [Firmicutes bacterium]|nr:iron-sulfur cluster repair di-iron protein, ric [Bacillota bacterium]
MTIFDAVKTRNLERLSQYVPIVARVHGGSHPEFHNVKSVFEQLRTKIQAAGSDKPQLDSEFQELRQITDNYTVPGDVCESYEAVYNMLSELDNAYQA